MHTLQVKKNAFALSVRIKRIAAASRKQAEKENVYP
jgi:hypothetical protein